MKIGLVPIAAKPFHKGHDGLIRLASSENDEVSVFVSYHDRNRPNEIKVNGDDMVTIWEDYIIPTMPNNVYVDFVHNPQTATWNEIENPILDCEYTIYGDENDVKKRFTKAALAKNKKVGDLLKNNILHVRGVNRSEIADISGTLMRNYIKTNDKKSFYSGLPDTLDKLQKSDIWNILTKAKRS